MLQSLSTHSFLKRAHAQRQVRPLPSPARPAAPGARFSSHEKRGGAAGGYAEAERGAAAQPFPVKGSAEARGPRVSQARPRVKRGSPAPHRGAQSHKRLLPSRVSAAAAAQAPSSAWAALTAAPSSVEAAPVGVRQAHPQARAAADCTRLPPARHPPSPAPLTCGGGRSLSRRGALPARAAGSSGLARLQQAGRGGAGRGAAGTRRRLATPGRRGRGRIPITAAGRAGPGVERPRPRVAERAAETAEVPPCPPGGPARASVPVQRGRWLGLRTEGGQGALSSLGKWRGVWEAQEAAAAATPPSGAAPGASPG